MTSVVSLCFFLLFIYIIIYSHQNEPKRRCTQIFHARAYTQTHTHIHARARVFNTYTLTLFIQVRRGLILREKEEREREREGVVGEGEQMMK